MEKILWEIFKKSGDIRAFIIYKEYEKLNNGFKNKKIKE